MTDQTASSQTLRPHPFLSAPHPLPRIGRFAPTEKQHQHRTTIEPNTNHDPEFTAAIACHDAMKISFDFVQTDRIP